MTTPRPASEGMPTLAPGPRLGYLVKMFPRLSETFILDEILALQAHGIDLRVYSLGDPREARVQPAVARLQGPVGYLREPRGPLGAVRRLRQTITAHARLSARAPGRYLRATRLLLTRRFFRSRLRHFAEAGRLARDLERDAVTHLHAGFAHGPATVAYFVHLLTGMPFSFAGHAKDIYLSEPEFLARKAAHAEAVVTCSAAAADHLRQVVGPNAGKIVLRLHGVDVARFQPRRARPATAAAQADPGLRVLAVGRLVPKKGYPVLLAALAELAGQGRKLSCDIIGGGELRDELEAMVGRLGLSQVVRLHGARGHDEVASSLTKADVFVQASVVLPDGDRDGIPNALLEAMASGLPVVASAVSGIPEVIMSGETGLLVTPGDPAALAAALARLADNPSLRERLGCQARRHVAETLDRGVCESAVAELFAGLLAGRTGRREPVTAEPAVPLASAAGEAGGGRA